MRSLKCWLTCRRNGLYLVTAFKPEVVTVCGTGHKDAYVKPGDPVGYNNITPEFVDSVFEEKPDVACKPMKVEMYGRRSGGGVTHYIYDDAYNNMFHIVRSLDISIKHICPWFVNTLFGFEYIKQHYEAVEFWGKSR